MKLQTTAVLATAALASAQSLFEVIETELDQRITFTQDGQMTADFSPYLHVHSKNELLEGTVTMDLLGNGKPFVDNWKIGSDNSITLFGSGHGASLGAMPLGEVLDNYTYNVKVVPASSMSDMSVSYTKDITLNYLTQGQGKIAETINLAGDLTFDKGQAIINLDLNAERKSNNILIENQSIKELFAAPYAVSSNAKITVANVKNCKNYPTDMSKPCDVKFQHKSSWNGDSTSHTANLKLREYAIIVKLPTFQVVFKGENVNGQSAKINAGLYYSLYKANGKGNWQKALRSKKADLIFRLPGVVTMETTMYDEIMNKADPFSILIEKLAEDPRSIPYVIYYLDELLADFNDEFDCSELVRISRVESDLLADAIEWPGSINDLLVEQCVGINEVIVEALHCEELNDGFETMREFVSLMASNEGFQDFDEKYGSIF